MPGHDTEWRQGSLLTDKHAHALDLVGSIISESQVVVISHDCDLQKDTEKFVEVIVGLQVKTPDPMLANARNPRRLHLRFSSDTDGDMYIELSHANRRQVCKEDFATVESSDKWYSLTADEKRTLKQWLAARYGRPAFPSSFEQRLRKKKDKKSVEQLIAKILKPSSLHLVGLFFDLGEHRNVELADGDAYFLSISVVYDATQGGQIAKETAENVAGKLRSLFEKTYGTAQESTEIALEACTAVADTFITLADLRKVDQWRLEYISLRDNTADGFIPAGKMPL